MKRFFVIISLLFIFNALAQENKIYTYLVHVNDYKDIPEFTVKDGLATYSDTDASEKLFFSKYKILEFNQSFPDARWKINLDVFTVSSYNESLVKDMIREYPGKYLTFDDITNLKIESTYTYPNDYGITSPVANSGASASLKNMDYIKAPKAWDYLPHGGDANVKIGISDPGRLNFNNPDLVNKTVMINPGYYQNSPYDMNNDYTWHGTAVAGVAAAQGGNGYGIAGVCYNCSVVGTNSGINNNLFVLVRNHGVKIFNMSWVTGTTGYASPNVAGFSAYQNVINELHYCDNVVFVAGAGNWNSWNQDPVNGNWYYFPASLNHVISVTSVNHKNQLGEQTTYVEGWGEVSQYVEDVISRSVVTNYQGNGPYVFWSAHTTNDLVDIAAPGFRVFRFERYTEEGVVDYYGDGGTSIAAPHVTGTAGLMKSINPNLWSDEVEDILQLTSGNLESNPLNSPYIGKAGSGKLDAGDAAEFVDEMKKATGNAVIADQDFHRFNFDLRHINNKLTISNQKFRDNCIANFTARNIIEILPNTDLNPNSSGLINLQINAGMDINEELPIPQEFLEACSNNTQRMASEKTSKNVFDNEKTKLYPNPNNGTFDIALADGITGDVSINVVDITGKTVYVNTFNTSVITINIPNLSSGIYMVKLSNSSHSETIKFIKQ